MPDESRIGNLLVKNLRNELSEGEKAELDAWLAEHENSTLMERLSSKETIASGLKILMEMDDASIIRKLNRLKEPGLPDRRLASPWRFMAAAGVVGLLALSVYLWIGNKTGRPVRSMPAITYTAGGPRVARGSNKATLTLSDGRTVNLGSQRTEPLTIPGKVEMIRDDSGQLVYSLAGTPGRLGVLTYNILSTPKSGQYRLLLPDGTKVWLNNASSLRYPTIFPANSREVELIGEAYFEVADNPSKPFKVLIGSPRGKNGTVVVLGTRFDVKSYADEDNMKTSLLEGSVRLSCIGGTAYLKTGEQATVSAAGKMEIGKEADMAGEIAWTKGYFHFSGATLPTVFRQLARWYDQEVRFEGPVSNLLFDGDIQRDLPLATVLQMLEKNQVGHFSIDDKMITIRPW